MSLVCSTPVLSDAGIGADVLAGVARLPHQVACDKQAATDGPVLRVMTLNAAHGRRDGPNQLFLGRSSFVDNLAEISALLREHEADIVALQEVDGPSRWSGMIDHAQSVARSAEYPWQYRGDHATRGGADPLGVVGAVGVGVHVHRDGGQSGQAA